MPITSTSMSSSYRHSPSSIFIAAPSVDDPSASSMQMGKQRLLADAAAAVRLREGEEEKPVRSSINSSTSTSTNNSTNNSDRNRRRFCPSKNLAEEIQSRILGRACCNEGEDDASTPTCSDLASLRCNCNCNCNSDCNCCLALFSNIESRTSTTSASTSTSSITTRSPLNTSLEGSDCYPSSTAKSTSFTTRTSAAEDPLNGSKSNLSIYQSLLKECEDIAITSDNNNDCYKFGQRNDRLHLQRSQSVEYTARSYWDRKSEAVATISSSPPFTVTATATSYIDDAYNYVAGADDTDNYFNTYTDTPVPSSFYQAALEEATLTEEEEEQLLQRQRDLLLEQQEERSSQTGKTSTDRAIMCTPSRNGNHSCSPRNSTAIPYANSPISPFYRAALEDAALAEEEAEELLLLQEQQNQDQYQADRRDFIVATNSSTCTEDNVGSCVSSSFYQSALKEAAIAEQELCLEEKLHEGEDGDEHENESEHILVAMGVEARVAAAFTPGPYPQSFVDDNASLSRSAVPPETSFALRTITNSTQRAEAAGELTKSTDVFVSTRKENDGNNQILDCKEETPNYYEDENDDEDIGLRWAMYLSTCESPTTPSLNSKGNTSRATSASFFTERVTSCSASEEEGQDEGKFGDNPAFGEVKATRNVDQFMVSQRKAMEEYERSNKNIVSSESQPRMCRHVSAPCMYPSSSIDNNVSSSLSGGRRRQPRRLSSLEARGTTETREAISNGNSQVVKCKGCQGRLKAPVNYSLVFCPKCQTISPT